MNQLIQLVVRVFVLLAMPALVSCSAPQRYPAVPDELTDRVTVLNNPAIRTWQEELNPQFIDAVLHAAKREAQWRQQNGDDGPLPPAYYLAISGGGENGAYGAGLLNGWTAAGTRPQFKIVTGISTGALTAPFAFLGPEYDDELRTVYTSVDTDEIATKRGLLAVLFSDSMMDTAPLRSLLETLVNEQMRQEIAREYQRGRLLFVATTDLDANRGVIWNVGEIACSGDPAAVDLIQDILIASAAIPGAFPPVMIDVELDGKQYQEMHVDGGARAQVFLYPPTFHLKERAAAEHITRDRIAYVVRNSRLDPEWSQVQRKTLSIAQRAIGSMIQTQGIGNLYDIYLTTQRDGVGFNLAYIPETFHETPEQEFDPVYMTKLFQVGYDAAMQPGGYPWDKAPPGFEPE